MAHLIELPFDRFLSTQGTEWHGLAEKVDAIGREQAEPLFFPIVEGKPVLSIDGEQTTLEDWKVIATDLRGRADLVAMRDAGTLEGGLIRPLHVPKSGYHVIDNATVFEGMERALDGIPCAISTIGTLAGCRRFFISVALENNDSIVLPRGEACKAFVNFITSHDGSLAMEAYDSSVRIVCNNTLNFSLDAAGKVGFKMYHTPGSAARIMNMGDLIAEILSGRQQYSETMEGLASQNATQESCEKIVSGYFAITQDVKADKALSTRSRNAVDSIVELAWKGRGNVGGNLYDLLNGFTEFYSEGEGSGNSNTRDKGRKVFSANFGKAMDHKRTFSDMISNGGTLQKMRIAGGKAMSNAPDRPVMVAVSARTPRKTAELVTSGASNDTSGEFEPLVVIG